MGVPGPGVGGRDAIAPGVGGREGDLEGLSGLFAGLSGLFEGLSGLFAGPDDLLVPEDFLSFAGLDSWSVVPLICSICSSNPGRATCSHSSSTVGVVAAVPPTAIEMGGSSGVSARGSNLIGLGINHSASACSSVVKGSTLLKFLRSKVSLVVHPPMSKN